MNRPICEKIGDWHRLDYPTYKECSDCSSNKCPIKVCINTIMFMMVRMERLEAAQKTLAERNR